MTKWLKTLTTLSILSVFSLSNAMPSCATPDDEWHRNYLEGDHARDNGEYRKAQRAYESALQTLKKSGNHSSKLGLTLERLTESYLLGNDPKAAEPVYCELYDSLHSNSLAKLDQPLVLGLRQLANVYQQKWSQFHDARCLEHSLEILQVANQGDNEKALETMMALSRLYVTEGHAERGVDLLKHASAKASSKDTVELSRALFQQAMQYQVEGNFNVSSQLISLLLRLTNMHESSLRAGLPVFYVMLGTNSLAQGESAQARSYYSKSIQEGLVEKRYLINQPIFVSTYADPLRTSIVAWKDRADSGQKRACIESELTQLKTVSQAVTKDPGFESEILSLLSDVLYQDGKSAEADKCRQQAIALAKHQSGADQRNELAEMYLKTAIARAQDHQMSKASDAFASAMKEEKDKKGEHSARVLFWWAFYSKANGQPDVALAKTDGALKIARSVKPVDRENVLSNLLSLRLSCDDQRTKSQTRQLAQELIKEIAVQQKLDAKTGAKFYTPIDQSVTWMKDVPPRSVRLGSAKGVDSSAYGQALAAGHKYEKTNQYSEVLGAYKQALSSAERFGKDSKQVATSLANIGYLLVKADQVESATPYYQRILNIVQGLGPARPPKEFDADTCVWINDFSDAYHDHAIASPAMRETCAMYGYTLRLNMTCDHDILASDVRELSVAQFGEKKYLAAEEAYKVTVAHTKEKWGANHVRLIPDLEKMADYQETVHKDAEAADNLRHALFISCSQPINPEIISRLATKLERAETAAESPRTAIGLGR